MKLKHLVIALAWAFSAVQLHAQTNPSAVTLPFNLTSQSSATLPSGVAVHRYSSIQTTRTLSPANGGDLPNQGSTPTNNAGGWYHLGADGIGLLASGSNPAGAVVVAINTTGSTNISVSWNCKTIYNQASRDNSMALQYRVGTTGNFINVGSTSTYSSTGNANGHTSSTFTEMLPAGAENQAVVQVRWIYWESNSTSGSRDKISVDNISISASSSPSCSAPTGLAASSVTTTGASISWSSVAGASSYEYALNTTSTPPSSGTGTGSTSYPASGLTPGTLYYFHVRTNCSGSFSGWSSTSFETIDTASSEEGEIKIMTYNLLNYPGSTGATREPSYRTIINDVQPDVLVVQELSQVSGASSFLSNVMNYSTSTYSLGTVIDGPDSDNAIYFKTSLFSFVSNTPVSTSLRDINEFKLRHTVTGDTLIFYSVHLKASNTAVDEAQRTAEVDALRAVTDAMPSGRFFMVCGDFNIYSANEDAYIHLTQAGSNPNGNFNDVLSMPGTWNNSSYAIHHTQSPRTTSFGGGATGGMDDRFDMILFSDAIVNTGGYDVVSGSYLAYGNDGMHYNAALNTPPYTMYSSTIAAALHDASDHIPVVVRLSYGSSLMVRQPAADPVSYSRSKTSVTMNDALSIYPNPAQEKITIRFNDEISQPANLVMYDVTGKAVYTFSVKAGAKGSNAAFELPSLNAGMYFLRSDELGGVYKLLIH